MFGERNVVEMGLSCAAIVFLDCKSGALKVFRMVAWRPFLYKNVLPEKRWDLQTKNEQKAKWGN